MKIEILPLIAGALVALLGVALVFDGWLQDGTVVRRERRRSPRRERSRGGEVLVGLGMLCMAGALLGRDTWRYRILVAIVGAVLLVIGTLANRAFIGSLVSRRGASRRADPPIAERGGAPGPALDAPVDTGVEEAALSDEDRRRIR
jgi:uncharacterized membrane protein